MEFLKKVFKIQITRLKVEKTEKTAYLNRRFKYILSQLFKKQIIRGISVLQIYGSNDLLKLIYITCLNIYLKSFLYILIYCVRLFIFRSILMNITNGFAVSYF